MDKFRKFKHKIQEHFTEMTKDVVTLYEVNLDKEELWNTYLGSFAPGTNPVYRERTEHDCNCCKQFIRQIGGAVAIKNTEVHTIWDVDMSGTIYEPVAKALADLVRSKAIAGVCVLRESKIGTDFNHEMNENGTVHTWEHFHLVLPNQLINTRRDSDGEIKGEFKSSKDVFKRSLDELTVEAVDTVLELIASNTLYKGVEWRNALREFRKYQGMYAEVPDDKKDLFVWEQTSKAISCARIRNSSIGTLLVNISEGMELDLAVRKYEEIVAPANYKRPKAIYTKRMLEDAKKTITELGYMDSLKRRHATIDDITVNNILFANKDVSKRIVEDDIFGEMEKEVAVNPKKFSRVEEVKAEDFIEKILPTAKEIEVLLENKHTQNMVSLIAPEVDDAPTMFKWNNGMSWAYTGNMTDSDIRENVKAAGGKIVGDLRFSIQWNDVGDGKDDSDLDAHCATPKGEIYYMDKKRCGGELDVDIRHPMKKVAVENIVFTNKRNMISGKYKFFVHQFEARGSKDGFRAEIEFNGEVYSYDYRKPLKTKENVPVATVTLDDFGNFTIEEKLPSTTSSREVWGVTTNQFVPVSVVCYSPNYWDEQNGIGHKHLFFMLNGCKNEEEPNGYYNEFLKNELNKHRKVFEALGAKCSAKCADDQLSGVGFSMTKRAEVFVRVKGATERVIKVKF